jgi:hypothetical protein
MKALIIAAILVPFVATAQTPSAPKSGQLSVFGIPLLQPLSQSECSYMRVDKEILYNPPKNTSCYEFWDSQLKGSGKIPATATVSLKYPFDQNPQLAVSGVVVTGILNGVVQSISFNTYGLSSAERDLKTLTDKFGTPANIQHPSLQSRLGATFTGTEAHWDLANGITVDFDATADGLDTGFVMIQTAAASEARKAALERLNSKQTQQF